MSYLLLEGFRRLMQIIFGMQMFTFPLLYQIRRIVYKCLFGMGCNCRIGHSVIIHREHGCKSGSISIMNRVLLADNVKIDFSGHVTIEDDVWISENVHIHTHTHSTFSKVRNKDHNACTQTALHIGKGAWLGDSSIILPSCHRIGEGAIVAAGSVVTKDVDEGTIVGGGPAHFIKHIK